MGSEPLRAVCRSRYANRRSMKTKLSPKANKASPQNRASRRPGVALQPLVLRWGKIEVRLNADESVDEIVASNVSLHLEQMDDGYWWMGISRPNGERMMVNLYTKHRAAIAVNAESEDGRISVGFTKKAQNVGLSDCL